MKGLLSLNKPIILLCFLAMACTPLPLPQDIPSSPKPEATTIVQPQAIPEPTPTPTFDPFQPPVIEKITPTSAKPGDIITIDGTDFSPNADDNIVEFGDSGQYLKVMEASVNRLTVRVPPPIQQREANISISRIVLKKNIKKGGQAQLDEFRKAKHPTMILQGIGFSPNIEDNRVQFKSTGFSSFIGGGRFKYKAPYSTINLTIVKASETELEVNEPIFYNEEEGTITVFRNMANSKFDTMFKIILEHPIVTTYIDHLNPGYHSALSISGIAIDKDKNIYASDGARHCLYKITPDEQVTVFAGRCALLETDYPFYRDGLGTDAGFNSPGSIVIGPDENLYVADPGNHRIRKITPDAMVTTFAGNDYTVEKAVDQAFDHEGNLYVIEQSYLSDQRYSVKRITREGNVTTIRLQPTIKDISFCTLAIDQQGDLYVGGCNEFKIWKIHVNGIYGDVSSFISHDKYGSISDKVFDQISDMVFDQQGNLWVIAYNNYSILKIFPNGDMTTVAGSGEKGNADGAVLQAQFNQLRQIAIDQKGDLLVSDDWDALNPDRLGPYIRKIFLVN